MSVRTRATEKREADSSAQSPGAVDDRADHHRHGREARGHRLALERRDDEPRDQRGKDSAEHQCRSEQARAVETARVAARIAPQIAPQKVIDQICGKPKGLVACIEYGARVVSSSA
jgi:hypothetical protein